MKNASLTVRNNKGLSNEELIKHCPSIFAVNQHESRSSKYQFIPTSNIIEGMKKEGFYPVFATQSSTKIEGKENFTKHMLRFRSIDDLQKEFVVGNRYSEIVFLNSHDGSSVLDLKNGVFEVKCANGLMVGNINDEFKVRHQGDIINDVITMAYKIIDNAKESMSLIDDMQKIQLSRNEQLLLSETAMSTKFNMNETVFTAEQFLRVRRQADNQNDLYTTFNRIQENFIKGGITTRDRNYKRHTTRAVNSIDGDIKTNQILWELAKSFLALKTH